MKTILTTLLRLAEIDNSIDQLIDEQIEIPQNIKAVQADIAGLQKQLNDRQNELTSAETLKKECETFVTEKNQWLKDRETRLNEIATSKEYQAAQKEVSIAKKEIKDKETLAQSLSSKLDLLNVDFKSITESNTPKIAELTTLITEQTARLDRLESLIGELNTKRAVVLKDVTNQQVLNSYDLIHKRTQPAMAKADDGNCAECGTRILPQTLNLLKIGDHVYNCTRCKRILYLEELLQG